MRSPLAVLALWPWLCTLALAQDLEPRRWTHLPVGTNVLGVGYGFTTGDIEIDPVLRLDDVEVEMHTGFLIYNRTFELLDTTARVDAILPVQSGSWTGMLDGQPASRMQDGLADPILRLSIGLVGMPPLSSEAFFEYHRSRAVNTVVGAGVAVRVPLGDYEEDRLINLGQNRFVVEPQLGVLHTRGPWSFELTGSTFVYTDNDEFFGGNELEQDPLWAVQGHVVRTLSPGWWVACGAAYGWAGESTINGIDKDDDKRNVLLGASFGLPIGREQGLRFTYIRGLALEDVGTDSHNFLLSWSLRF